MPISSLHARYRSVLYQDDGKSATTSVDLWYHAPDRVRIDIVEEGSTRTQMLTRGLSVQYASDGQAAVHTPSSASAKALPAKWRVTTGQIERSDGRIVGVKSVAGRMCDVLKTGSTADGSSTCVDRSTGFVLAQTLTQNRKTLFKNSAQLFEPNTVVPDEIFQPQPPKGMPNVRAAFESSAVQMLTFHVTPQDIAGPWSLQSIDINELRPSSKASTELAAQARNSGHTKLALDLYAPLYVPARFRLLKAMLLLETKRTKSGGYTHGAVYDRAEIAYLDPRTGDTLIVLEFAKPPDEGPSVADEVVTHSHPFRYAVREWEKEGLYLKLGATNVSKAQVAKVAASLARVSAE